MKVPRHINFHFPTFPLFISIKVLVLLVLLHLAFGLPYPLSKQIRFSNTSAKTLDNHVIDVNSVVESPGFAVEEELKKLMLKALHIDPHTHFNQNSEAIPPIMLRLWEIEQSRHLLFGGDNHEFDKDLVEQVNGGEEYESNYTFHQFQKTWLYNLIHPTKSMIKDRLEYNTLNDLLHSSQTQHDSRYLTVDPPIISSVIASRPLSILSNNETKIDIEYHLKGDQVKNLMWVELVLHRKLKIKQLNQQTTTPSAQILVCITLESHNATTIGAPSCIPHPTSLESTDDFIHLNISRNSLQNFNQVPTVRISISISEVSDTLLRRPNLYVMEIESKYAPFLLLYKNSAKARYTEHTSPKPSKARSKRRITPSNESMCQLHEWYIDFSTLGWSDWFVKPNGRCTSPLLNENYNASMHSLIKDLWILATKGKGKPVNRAGNITNIPKASCVPIEYESLSVLYIEDSNIVLKHLDGMSASRCGCR